MKITEIIIKIVLGSALTFFGLNGFFNWWTPPSNPEPNESLINLMVGISESGYILPISFGLMVFSGLSLLTNKFVNLGMILISPILLNIVLIHLFLEPAGIAPGALLAILISILYYLRRDNFMTLFKLK